MNISLQTIPPTMIGLGAALLLISLVGRSRAQALAPLHQPYEIDQPYFPEIESTDLFESTEEAEDQ